MMGSQGVKNVGSSLFPVGEDERRTIKAEGGRLHFLNHEGHEGMHEGIVSGGFLNHRALCPEGGSEW